MKPITILAGDPSTLTHDSTPDLDGQNPLDWRTLLPYPENVPSGHEYNGVWVPAEVFWTVMFTYWETDGGRDANARYKKDNTGNVIGLGPSYVIFRIHQKDGNGVLDYFQAGFRAYGLRADISICEGRHNRSPALRVQGRNQVRDLLAIAFAHGTDANGQPPISSAKYRDLHLLAWFSTYTAKDTPDAVVVDAIFSLRKACRHDPDNTDRSSHAVSREDMEARLNIASTWGAAAHITRITDDAYAQRLIELSFRIAMGDAKYFSPYAIEGVIGGDGGFCSRLLRLANGTMVVRTSFSIGMELTALPTLIAVATALGVPANIYHVKGKRAYVLTVKPSVVASTLLHRDLQPLGINTKRVDQITLAREGDALGATRDKVALHAWIDRLYDHLDRHGDTPRRKLNRVQQHERIDSWIDHGIPTPPTRSWGRWKL